MKKAISLVLAAVFALSLFFLAPASSSADTNGCFNEHETCRGRALDADAGVVRMTLMLTVCDIALGTCLISNALAA